MFSFFFFFSFFSLFFIIFHFILHIRFLGLEPSKQHHRLRYTEEGLPELCCNSN